MLLPWSTAVSVENNIILFVGLEKQEANKWIHVLQYKINISFGLVCLVTTVSFLILLKALRLHVMFGFLIYLNITGYLNNQIMSQVF